MDITPEKILTALKEVEDPDLKRDLVSLGMIKDVVVNGKKVSFTVVLTTPACPLKEHIRNACLNAIHLLVDSSAEVDIKMDAVVSSGRKAGDAVLGTVKNIVAIASGKGGVGKSTVSMNLAVALARSGAKTGLLDADLYGPSIPLMSGMQNHKPGAITKDGRQMIEPLENFGIRMMSIGFLMPAEQALVWRGPMVAKALTQFITDVDWGELDYLIIDLPPGTGDVHLTLAQQLPLTGVIIVTTPQEVALADARKAIAMFNHPAIKAPVLGIVENMSWFSPVDMPEKKYFLFGKDGGKRLAAESQVPLLGQIPVSEVLREGGDTGMPAAFNAENSNAIAFDALAGELARLIAIQNAPLQTVSA